MPTRRVSNIVGDLQKAELGPCAQEYMTLDSTAFLAKHTCAIGVATSLCLGPSLFFLSEWLKVNSSESDARNRGHPAGLSREEEMFLLSQALRLCVLGDGSTGKSLLLC